MSQLDIIVDTNMLLHHLYEVLERDNVCIPYVVLGELDEMKQDNDAQGFKARRAVRAIIQNEIKTRYFEEGIVWDENTSVDDKLVHYCTYTPTKLVTNDFLLSLRADAKGGNCELYTLKEREVYEGVKEGVLPEETINDLYEHGRADACELDLDLNENEFFDTGKVIAKYRDGVLFKVGYNKTVRGFDKLNRRQLMAYDLLYDPKVKVVILWGKAGTGKTALSIKSAIQMQNQEDYIDVLLSRPTVQNGTKEEKLATLPGDVESKQAPFMKPFQDNMDSFQTLNVPSIQPLTTIQGRSIKDTFYIIDEAQNIAPTDMPHIVERMGEESKLIISGDPRQIIRRDLNYNHNGISFASNSLKESELVGCVHLTDNERSEMSKLGDVMREVL